MLAREEITKRIDAFKVKLGTTDEQDEHVVAALHLHAQHQIALDKAQDRTSRGSNDNGIDAWHFDPREKTLYLYQSKLASGKSLAASGFADLVRAAEWLGQALCSDDMGAVPTNPCIYNLVQMLSQHRKDIHVFWLRLISPFDHNELDDMVELDKARQALASTRLRQYASDNGLKLKLDATTYNLEQGIIPPPTHYLLEHGDGHTIRLGNQARLDVMTTPLIGLVELFRQRGNNLFEKNVRLYLGTKESRFRLEHPMEETLNHICDEVLEPSIFPFYHIGVTLTARTFEQRPENILALESPYVINGCQTINIADRFLRSLEKQKDQGGARLARFKLIHVVAKLVTGATEDQLREIANCNNRQNPIAAWQLFSNDPVHIEIEAALRDVGVFYERQKGKFDSLMRKVSSHTVFTRTNGTFVTVEGLGQVICLCRRLFPLAAKPSDIFASKDIHDSVFDRTIPHQVRSIIWAWNAHKAVKRALSNYLQLAAHDNPKTHRIFIKPNVKQMTHYLAMRHLYQCRAELCHQYIWRLNKIAPPGLVQEAESFYRRVVLRIKSWYLQESKDLTVEVSARALEGFLTVIETEVGLSTDGPMSFTDTSSPWPEDVGEDLDSV